MCDVRKYEVIGYCFLPVCEEIIQWEGEVVVA